MSYQPLDEKTVGLYSKNGVIQAAFIAFENRKFSIKQLIEYPIIEEEEDVKPLYMDPKEKELAQFSEEHLTIASLNESDVLVRRLKLKLTRDKDIDEAFVFQAEPLLPYPVENAVLDKLIVEKSEDSTLLVFLAAKKEYLHNLLTFWQAHGIDPEVVSAEPVALNALLNAISPSEPLQFAVHIGQTSTLCLMLKEGKLLASHSISSGWKSLSLGLEKDFPEPGNSDSELFSSNSPVLETEKAVHLKNAIDELLQAILWNYLSLMKETRSSESPSLYVLGAGANVPELPSLIAASLGINLGALTAFSDTCSLEDLNKFAIPIGLGLTAQNKNFPSVNFRQKEFTYATPWKRFKKRFVIFATLCALLAGSLYLFGLSAFKYKEDQLKERFLTLLTFTQKPYDVFETLYEEKHRDEKKESGIIPLNELNASDISRRLDFLEMTIKAMPDTFPLLPNIPRVSDVLVWLGAHSQQICKSLDETECPSFSIDLFNYTLVKRPEISKKNERYQVKVDLEFTTASPRLAREFHDALITSNDFVDPKGEIKWTATKGKYRTSFYLKDRTAYP